jgi:hypothetical protein
MEDEKYLFIDDLPAFLLAQTGLRLSVPTLHKMTSPGVGTGPPSAGFWGKRQVFKPSQVLAWAAARVRPEKSSLGPKKMPATRAGKRSHMTMKDIPERDGSSNKNNLAAALDLAARGLPVFPCRPDDEVIDVEAANAVLDSASNERGAG